MFIIRIIVLIYLLTRGLVRISPAFRVCVCGGGRACLSAQLVPSRDVHLMLSAGSLCKKESFGSLWPWFTSTGFSRQNHFLKGHQAKCQFNPNSSKEKHAVVSDVSSQDGNETDLAFFWARKH